MPRYKTHCLAMRNSVEERDGSCRYLRLCRRARSPRPPAGRVFACCCWTTRRSFTGASGFCSAISRGRSGAFRRRDADTALELTRRFEPHVALVAPGPSIASRRLSAASSPGSARGPTSSCSLTPTRSRRARSGHQGLPVLSHGGGPPTICSRRFAVPASVSPLAVSAASSIQPVGPPERDPAALADGATNGEIAVRLYLSRDTVKQHASALYRKLGARNRTHAVQTARHQGLIAV